MTRDDDRGLSAEESAAIAQRIREELARRRMSRQKLADTAKISISTLEKALAGRRPFTLATIVRLEDSLALPLRPLAKAAVEHANGSGGQATAPDGLGNYSRAAVKWLEGSYLTLRPSFGDKGAVYAYRTDVFWDEAASCLAFREAERVDTDFTQFGQVAVPHQSGHVYFVTNRHGQHRLIVVARPIITGEMHGILTTLQAGKGAHLSPVATPIVLQPLEPGAKASFGRIAAGHASYPAYRALLRKTIDDHFAEFLPA
jgi:transcriptional regulator with XRE-family HTH domain